MTEPEGTTGQGREADHADDADADGLPGESGLEELAQQVGEADPEPAAEGDLRDRDDEALDLGTLTHSTMPRPPRAAEGFAPPRPVTPASEPMIAVSRRLLQGLALGFALGVAAGWGLFADSRRATPLAGRGPQELASGPVTSPPAVAAAVKSVPHGAEGPAGPAPAVEGRAESAESAGSAVDAQAVLQGPGVPVHPAAEAPSQAVAKTAGGPAREAPIDSSTGKTPPAERKRPSVLGKATSAALLPEADKAPLRADVAPAKETAAAASIDAMLDRALRGQNVAPPEHSVPALPATPTQQDVAGAIRVLVPAISGCAGSLKGIALVALVVRSTGRVATARVSGAPFEGTPAGRCMEGVVRQARFPRFSKATFRVQLPLKLE